MNNMNNANLQDSIYLINQLASLCATNGINETTQKIANDQIQKLLTSVITPAITKVSASSAGLVTN